MAFKLKEIKVPGVTNQYAGQEQIVDQRITVGQLYRGGKTIQKWIDSIQAAERLYSPMRKALYDLYLDVTIDGYLTSIMDKRIRAVKTSPWTWGEDVPDGVKDAFEEPWFYELMGQIMERKFYGYQLIEVKVNQNGIYDTEIVPRQNVRGELNLITYDSYSHDGINYKEGIYPKFIFETGKPKELGLLSRLSPYVLMKRDNMVFWAYFNQFFGMPLRVYKYQAGNTQQRLEIEKNAKDMSAAGYIILPHGSEVDLKDSNKSGARDTYGDLQKALNEEMAITVLGQTLTTSNDGVGSNALGRVHKAVEEAVNLEDMLVTEYIINYKFREICLAHGYPLQNLKGHFQRTEQLSMSQKMTITESAHRMGVDFSEEYFWEEFGWDKSHITINSRPSGFTNMPELPEPPAEVGLWYENAREQYAHHRPQPYVTLGIEQEVEKAFIEAMRLLHEGQTSEAAIPETLWNAIAQELFKGVERGFKGTLESLPANSPDAAMLKSLRDNIYVFSGFKTHQELVEASQLLFNNGKLRTWQQFRNAVLDVNNKYNTNYLYTEYQLAIGNAQIASKWVDIQRDKDTLPLLRFRAVVDDRSRHLQYNGITLPVDHPNWSFMTPLLDYGCRCTVEQVANGEVTKPDQLPGLELIKPQFRFNPGTDKVIFPKNHPYYNVQDRYRAQLQAQIDAKIRSLDGNN